MRPKSSLVKVFLRLASAASLPGADILQLMRMLEYLLNGASRIVTISLLKETRHEIIQSVHYYARLVSFFLNNNVVFDGISFRELIRNINFEFHTA